MLKIVLLAPEGRYAPYSLLTILPRSGLRALFSRVDIAAKRRFAAARRRAASVRNDFAAKRLAAFVKWRYQRNYTPASYTTSVRSLLVRGEFSHYVLHPTGK